MGEEEGLIIVGALGNHQGMKRKPKTANQQWAHHVWNARCMLCAREGHGT